MRKEGREIVRDPVTVGIALLLPLVMLFLFGYAVNLDVEDVALGVWDQDRTPASRALVDRFVQSESFRLARSFGDGTGVEAGLQRGEVKAALVIAPRFHAALVRGEPAPVQVLIDGTNSMVALAVSGYAQAIVRGFTLGTATAGAARVPVETRVWFNAPLRSMNYIVPGLFGVILMAFPPLLTTLAIVREKETGSIQQVFASPLRPAEFIVGKLVPYGLIAFVEMLMVIVVGFLWFEVPFRGNLGFLLATSLIYVLVTVGIGLLISTVTRTQTVAMLLALIVTLMPSFLFSGFLFPIFTMPALLQLYTYVFPARYFVELSRDIVLKGGGLEMLWVNALLLLLYAAAVFAAAAWRFRKKLA
jgi:ABC-2 type transport system permease protein